MQKKLIGVLFTFGMVMSVAACGKATDSEEKTSGESTFATEYTEEQTSDEEESTEEIIATTEPEVTKAPETTKATETTKAPETTTEIVTTTQTETETTKKATSSDPYSEMRGYWTNDVGCANNENHIFSAADYRVTENTRYAVIGSYINDYFNIKVNAPDNAGRIDDDEALRINDVGSSAVHIDYLMEMRLINGGHLQINVHKKDDDAYSTPKGYITKKYFLAANADDNQFYYREIGGNQFVCYERENLNQYMILLARECNGYQIIYSATAPDKEGAELVISYIER